MVPQPRLWINEAQPIQVVHTGLSKHFESFYSLFGVGLIVHNVPTNLHLNRYVKEPPGHCSQVGAQQNLAIQIGCFTQSLGLSVESPYSYSIDLLCEGSDNPGVKEFGPSCAQVYDRVIISLSNLPEITFKHKVSRIKLRSHPLLRPGQDYPS